MDISLGLQQGVRLAILVFAVAVPFVSSTVFAKSPGQAAYAGELDAFMRTQMKAYRIPGAAIGIVRNGEIEYLAGYGIANADGAAVTADTPFLLASVTKSMTAVGVMQLVEAGKIDINDPVQHYLPWFEVAGGEGGEITVANLLYQTSGLSELEGVQAILAPDGPDALEAGVRDLANAELKFKPGEGWEYSNLNYNVLGLLIEAVSGQMYETYIDENIFVPLKMTHSYTSLDAARTGGATSGYYPFFGIPLVYDRYMPYSRATLPGGGVWSSASDMSHYLIAHLSGGRYGDASILSAASIAKLHKPGFELEPGYGYAMGWFFNAGFLARDYLDTLETDLKNYESVPIVFHEGDAANYNTIALLLPEQNFGVVVLMNNNDPTVDSALRGLAWDVTLIAYGGDAQYFPPWEESFVVRYSRWIFSAVTLLLAAEFVWASRALKKIRKEGGRTQYRARVILLCAGFPLVVDIALVAYLFLKLLPDNAIDLPTLMVNVPDVGILTVFILLLAVGWGTIRTVLYANAWIHIRSEPCD